MKQNTVAQGAESIEYLRTRSVFGCTPVETPATSCLGCPRYIRVGEVASGLFHSSVAVAFGNSDTIQYCSIPLCCCKSVGSVFLFFPCSCTHTHTHYTLFPITWHYWFRQTVVIVRFRLAFYVGYCTCLANTAVRYTCSSCRGRYRIRRKSSGTRPC